jgi:hypothetical protein
MKRIFTNFHRKISGTKKIKGRVISAIWEVIEETKEANMKRCAETNPQQASELY